MPELAEYSVAFGLSVDEGEWSATEKKLSESPINVGSFQPISSLRRTPSYSKEGPKVYSLPHRRDEPVFGIPNPWFVERFTGTEKTPFLKSETEHNSLSSKDFSIFLAPAGEREKFRREGKAKPQISEEATMRLRGHEKLLEKLIFFVEEEASALRPTIIRIEVLPAWSHEYEEKTGIVIQVEIRGTDEQRFSLWEGISERIDSLHDTLVSEEKDFLADQISVFVNQA